MRVALFSHVLLGITYVGGDREKHKEQQHRQKFPCTSPIEHLYISQFPFVFRNVFAATVRVTYFYFPLFLMLALVLVLLLLLLSSLLWLFVFRWPFSTAIQMGHSGPFNAIRSPAFGLLHNLNCLSAAVWSAFALVPSATRRKLNPKAPTTTESGVVSLLCIAGNCHRFVFLLVLLLVCVANSEKETTEITR